jgi:hypothetical protein
MKNALDYQRPTSATAIRQFMLSPMAPVLSIILITACCAAFCGLHVRPDGICGAVLVVGCSISAITGAVAAISQAGTAIGLAKFVFRLLAATNIFAGLVFGVLAFGV